MHGERGGHQKKWIRCGEGESVIFLSERLPLGLESLCGASVCAHALDLICCCHSLGLEANSHCRLCSSVADIYEKISATRVSKHV